MSDTFGRGPDPASSAATATSYSATLNLIRVIAYLGIVFAAGLTGYYGYCALQAHSVEEESFAKLTELRGLTQPVLKHLAEEYRDTDGNLLADPPNDSASLLDPETLVLAHYIDADADVQLVDWEALGAALAEATGKKIVLDEYLNSADDVQAVKTGAVHLVAMHAADTPYVVNNAGFVPIAVLGTEAGANGNRLDIAVPSDSKIEKLEDIAGHKLTCTAPDSMTGYRAAIIILRQQAGLRPDVDYSINFSHGQKRSIQGLVAGDYSVAALSDEKVQAMLKKGTLDDKDFRLIYTSKVIPRLTIGYVYNLNPNLTEKIAQAILKFENATGPPDETSGQPMRFLPMNYREDFEFVRQVDDSFDPRFSKATKSKAAPTPPAEAATN